MTDKHFVIGGASIFWSDGANWSLSSGGAGGAGAPGGSDTAIFDGGGLGPCVFDTAPSITAFDMRSGYTDTVDTAGFGLTTSGAFTVSAGVFVANDSILAIGGTCTIGSTSGLFLKGESLADLTGTGSVSNPTDTNAFYRLKAAAATKTTTLSGNVYARLVELGTGTVTSTSPARTLVCGFDTTMVSGEKVLTNAGATVGGGGGAQPLIHLMGDRGCTFDGRSYGAAGLTVSALEMTQETAAVTCGGLALISYTNPVNYWTNSLNVTINGQLLLGVDYQEATFNSGSSNVNVTNTLSAAVKLSTATSTINLESSIWGVVGDFDNTVGGNIKGGTSHVELTNLPGPAPTLATGGTPNACFHDMTLRLGARTVTDTLYLTGSLIITRCAAIMAAGKGIFLGGPQSTVSVVASVSSASLTLAGDPSSGKAAFISGGGYVEVSKSGGGPGVGATLTLTNVIVEKFHQIGVHVLNAGATAALTNVTFSANEVAVQQSAGTTTLKNCIIAGRPGQTAVVGSPTITYSNVQGGYIGTGNIDALPLFTDYGVAGYHLAPNSASIDAGDPASPYSNEPSPNGGRINQGCYGNTAGATTTQDNTWKALVAYDEQSNVIATAYGGQTVSESVYDPLSRLSSARNGLEEQWSFTYDDGGNRSAQVNPMGQPAYFVHDALNRLISTTAADGAEFQLTYDAVGNRRSATDPNGHSTYYDVDSLNRVTRIIDPRGVAAYYEFDAASNLVKDIDRVHQAAYYDWDALNRNTALAYDGGGQADYTYDAAGNLTYSDDMWGPAYYDHDAVNRLTRRQSPDARVVSWDYAADSTVETLVYPGATGSAGYSYDHRKRIVEVTSPSGNRTYYQFTPLDQIQTRVFDNGTYSYFTYDAAQRLKSIETSNASHQPVLYFEFDRNANGDITANRRETGLVHYYDYDEVRRLVSEKIYSAGMVQLYGFEYQFDAAGNRTYLKVTMASSAEIYYEYDAANAITRRHTLQTAAGRVAGWAYYSYDENGSLTRFQDKISENRPILFSWNENGLCESISRGQAGTYFFYDGRMTRYAMKDATGITYFTWDGMNLLQFTKGATTTTLTHGGTPMVGIGSVIEERTGSTSRYHHTDHRGTTFKITDSTGAVVWSGLVDAYGVELAKSGTSPSIFWYQGEAWFRLSAAGRTWYITSARVYDAEDGRFLEEDHLFSWPSVRLGAFPPLQWHHVFKRLRAIDPSAPYVSFHSNPLSTTDATGLDDTPGDPVTDWIVAKMYSGPYGGPRIALRLNTNLKPWQFFPGSRVCDDNSKAYVLIAGMDGLDQLWEMVVADRLKRILQRHFPYTKINVIRSRDYSTPELYQLLSKKDVIALASTGHGAILSTPRGDIGVIQIDTRIGRGDYLHPRTLTELRVKSGAGLFQVTIILNCNCGLVDSSGFGWSRATLHESLSTKGTCNTEQCLRITDELLAGTRIDDASIVPWGR